MASFKTAYLQRELVFDAAVKGDNVYADTNVIPAAASAMDARKQATDTTVVIVRDLVKYTPATTTVPGYIERVLSLADATHIVAQSDITLEYGHVPVENRDYRYFPVVNATFTGTVAANTPVKKVALFKIFNKDDVILDPSQGETA